MCCCIFGQFIWGSGKGTWQCRDRMLSAVCRCPRLCPTSSLRELVYLVTKALTTSALTVWLTLQSQFCLQTCLTTVCYSSLHHNILFDYWVLYNYRVKMFVNFSVALLGLPLSCQIQKIFIHKLAYTSSMYHRMVVKSHELKPVVTSL